MTETPNKRKVKRTNPRYTQRTLAALRELGYEAEVVERWIKFNPRDQRSTAGFRKDLFHFADIIALRPDIGICAVQSTGLSGHTAHRKSILENPKAGLWLKCGGRIMLWSWRKTPKPRADGTLGKHLVWTPRHEELTLKLFRTIEPGNSGTTKGRSTS